MKTLPLPSSSSVVKRMLGDSAWNAVTRPCIGLGKRYVAPTVVMLGLLVLFLSVGNMLQAIDPAAGILDIGILSVLLFGLLGGAVAIFVSLWLQELLWHPFKLFRQQFYAHFNQLTPWQQCMLYFLVFFLLLYAILWGLAMVL